MALRKMGLTLGEDKNLRCERIEEKMKLLFKKRILRFLLFLGPDFAPPFSFKIFSDFRGFWMVQCGSIEFQTLIIEAGISIGSDFKIFPPKNFSSSISILTSDSAFSSRTTSPFDDVISGVSATIPFSLSLLS